MCRISRDVLSGGMGTFRAAISAMDVGPAWRKANYSAICLIASLAQFPCQWCHQVKRLLGEGGKKRVYLAPGRGLRPHQDGSITGEAQAIGYLGRGAGSPSSIPGGGVGRPCLAAALRPSSPPDWLPAVGDSALHPDPWDYYGLG